MSLRLLAAAITVAGLALTPMVHAQETVEPEAAGEDAVTLPQAATAAGSAVIDTIEGNVSFYGREFAGRRTSSGERFDPAALTMAHKTLPFGTLVRVTSLQNLKSVVVRVNDRGPHIAGRIGDLSTAAAHALAMLHSGVVRVRLEVLSIMNSDNAK